MKIAIHGSKDNWAERWITICKKRDLDFSVVNCLDLSNFPKLVEYDIVFWMWKHSNPNEVLFAKEIIFTLERRGVICFPDFISCFHYNNKVLQEFQFSLLDVPKIESVFCVKRMPYEYYIDAVGGGSLVVKLATGAGSNSVYLIRSKRAFNHINRRLFGSGLRKFNRIRMFKDFVNNANEGSNLGKKLFKFFKAIVALVINSFDFNIDRERGYLYCQRFIEGSLGDVRLVVMGDVIFGFKRLNRENDWRASGSGRIIYDLSDLKDSTFDYAFEIADNLGMFPCAIDFIIENDVPKLVEVSYAFSMGKVYDDCSRIWRRNSGWENRSDGINPQEMILDNTIRLWKQKKLQ